LARNEAAILRPGIFTTTVLLGRDDNLVCFKHFSGNCVSIFRVEETPSTFMMEAAGFTGKTPKMDTRVPFETPVPKLDRVTSYNSITILVSGV
jgi:hypothetical protein